MILVFGGTTEGKQLQAFLKKKDVLTSIPPKQKLHFSKDVTVVTGLGHLIKQL
jgi:hypothetical protein